MPFRVGPTELIIIMAIVLLIFGAKRLPQIGGSMGRAIRSFHRGLSGTEQEAITDTEESRGSQAVTPRKQPRHTLRNHGMRKGKEPTK